MTQIYTSYVARFLDDAEVRDTLWALLKDASLADWQKMWILAALSQSDDHQDAGVKIAVSLLQDGRHGDGEPADGRRRLSRPIRRPQRIKLRFPRAGSLCC